ncbi:ABC transporter substrate-binding protein [Nocardioides caeni]|uniref:ABC transporter substrate-binding protein n=1 Tax=Nocardioides caeni TaxID=574700 RepID=A0A4S8N253_9ACTN|nr:ABC transporter substrate-binding protein [Nocardioides caeni]THV08884.1 ABC transporter substrate-binding protein [Nocardioides caeni]
MSTTTVRRRWHAAAALVVTASLALSACAREDDGGSSDSASATHEVEDYFGTVELPVDPQRVVAGDGATLGNLFALGVKPVAAAANANSLPHHLAEQMDGVVDVRQGDDVNWEKVLELGPDLFITFAGSEDDAWNKELYDAATATGVPTFGYLYNYVHLEQIEHNFTETARAVGKEDVATERLEALHDRIAELAERVEQAGLGDVPVSVLRVGEDGFRSIRIGTSESIAFRALGIAQPEGQTDPEQFSIDISEENLDLLDSAHTLFVYEDDTGVGELDEVESSPLWEGLPAVQAGRVHQVSSGVWNSIDITGFELILDDIEEYFIAPAEAG